MWSGHWAVRAATATAGLLPPCKAGCNPAWVPATATAQLASGNPYLFTGKNWQCENPSLTAAAQWWFEMRDCVFFNFECIYWTFCISAPTSKCVHLSRCSWDAFSHFSTDLIEFHCFSAGLDWLHHIWGYISDQLDWFHDAVLPPAGDKPPQPCPCPWVTCQPLAKVFCKDRYGKII